MAAKRTVMARMRTSLSMVATAAAEHDGRFAPFGLGVLLCAVVLFGAGWRG